MTDRTTASRVLGTLGGGMIGILFAGIAAANPLAPNPLAFVQDTAVQVAEQRQLPLLRPVIAEAYSEAELRVRIETSLAEDYKPEDIEGDTATLVRLGFAEPGIDLYATYLDIFVEQIGGFYDPDEQTLFLVKRAEGNPATEQVVVEHELVHALQDQSFGLSALDHHPFDDSDMETALRALVEGDASFFNILSMAGDFIGDLSDLPIGNGGALVQSDPGTALARAPDILARTLVFPYIQGAAFVQALHQSDGFRAVNTAYRSRPPLSTEQILHPGRYLSIVPDLPIAIGLPDLTDLFANTTRVVDEDTMGELGMLSWLEGVGGQDVVGAPLGWGGDRYRTYLSETGHPTVVWFTTWDTPEDAARFATAARGTVEVLYGGAWRRDGSLKGAPGRHARIQTTGIDVVIVLGAPRSQSRDITARLNHSSTRHVRATVSIFSPTAE